MGQTNSSRLSEDLDFHSDPHPIPSTSTGYRSVRDGYHLTELGLATSSTVTSQPCVDSVSAGTTPVLRDRRNLAVSVASQTCCPSASIGHNCNCDDESACGRGVLPSSNIYGSSPSPDYPPPMMGASRYLPQVTPSPVTTPTPIPSPPVSVASAVVSCVPPQPGCGHWCNDCKIHVQVEVECQANNEQRTRRPSTRGPSFKRSRFKVKSFSKDSRGIPKQKKSWPLKLNFRSQKSEAEPESQTLSSPSSSSSLKSCISFSSTALNFEGCAPCVRPSFRQNSHINHAQTHSIDGTIPSTSNRSPVIDLSRLNLESYPTEDIDEVARQDRAREIAEGIDPPPGFAFNDNPVPHLPFPYNSMIDLQILLERSLRLGLGRPRNVSTSLTEESLLHQVSRLTGESSVITRTVHTQVDYIHCLVPDLLNITNCSFYWGKMDRYEAERLLENRPEGTFLLRDSAQEEYLFSVSFRRHNRSLHARIEQWNHNFSFDSHDPGVFSSETVCGLIEHYKDPSCCMFFEPMLTNPVARTFPFPLQHLARARICNSTTYDGINYLTLPRALKNYLKEYHYKQRVRVRRLEN